MNYRKILVKYIAYFQKVVFSQVEYKKMIFSLVKYNIEELLFMPLSAKGRSGAYSISP